MEAAELLHVPCFSKKSETRDDLCAGALLWCKIKELLRHKIGRFLRIASLKRRKISMNYSLLIV